MPLMRVRLEAARACRGPNAEHFIVGYSADPHSDDARSGVLVDLSPDVSFQKLIETLRDERQIAAFSLQRICAERRHVEKAANRQSSGLQIENVYTGVFANRDSPKIPVEMLRAYTQRDAQGFTTARRLDDDQVSVGPVLFLAPEAPIDIRGIEQQGNVIQALDGPLHVAVDGLTHVIRPTTRIPNLNRY